MSEQLPPNDPQEPDKYASSFNDWEQQFVDSPQEEGVFPIAETENQQNEHQAQPEVRKVPRSYEDWVNERNRLQMRRDKVLDIAARTGDDSLLDAPWFNHVLGKLHTAMEQVEAFEQEARDGSE